MDLLSKPYFRRTTEAAPLSVFRILFGLMMFASIIRFWSYGWIDKLYIQPQFFFSYYGFEWIKPLGIYTYLIFAVCGASTIFIVVGYKYRLAIITFFLSFTYIELMDKTTYLNHYYFISILSFLMIFLPASAYYSIDASRKDSFQQIPQWTLDAVKLLLAIVYFYAGLSKLNSDWLLQAMPLKIWLPTSYDVPLPDELFYKKWAHYTFSWCATLYDLAIPFLLLHKRTRLLAFVAVVLFHVLTGAIFPIGMFPYIMIVNTLIFFDSSFHHSILHRISSVFRIKKAVFDTGKQWRLQKTIWNRMQMGLIITFFAVQLLFPFRYLLYPEELFWTEEGYRFSWRVMLMEKAGYANFKIVDAVAGNSFYINNSAFLSAFQEKQMATQPDFLLEYAHFLADHFKHQGHENIQVFVESYVALNGRRSQPYIDPAVDLSKEKESFNHKTWILPFNDDIKGL